MQCTSHGARGALKIQPANAPLAAPHAAGPAPTAPAAARREPTRAERRAAEELRAAYIAELEEREAARHSYAR